MEVPCCSYREAFVKQALKMAGKDVPVRSVIPEIEGVRPRSKACDWDKVRRMPQVILGVKHPVVETSILCN
jgi:hypothetical protein